MTLEIALEFVGLLLSVFATATRRTDSVIGIGLIVIFLALLVVSGGITL